ncbi:glycosyltransferase [Chloroflexota bacterium]
MLHKISLGIADVGKYRMVASKGAMDELESLGEALKGLRVCHVNSTPFGGGVAELLVSLIPLLRAVGINADWQVIRGDRRFFTITKGLHNALQGATFADIESERLKGTYRANNQENAQELDTNYDVFIINDPQPAALRHYLPDIKAKWIWRCHVDSSKPDEAVWRFLRPYIEEYDAAVFTAREFIPRDLNVAQIATMTPAISPLSSKNMFIERYFCRELVANLGFDTQRPLVTQVSRFDRWKDPFGTIAAYRLAKEKIPGIQLALIGSFAPDDPEAWDMHAALSAEAIKDDDMFIFSNLTGVGNMEVNAFQRASDVIVQKSIREGFGLVVSEALWKETPLVAGNAGGIPLQMTGELSNYLVNSVEECAEKMVYLLQNPAVGEKLGKLGKEIVRRNFLMNRLARDELRLIKSLVST